MSVTEQPTAVRRATLPDEQVGIWLAETYPRVAADLVRIGVDITGPPFARYVIGDGSMQVEAGFPVAERVQADGEISPSSLPPGMVAATTHTGAYESLEDAYRAVEAWLTDHNDVQAGGHWEVYVTDPSHDPDPAHWRTDVVVPYTDSGRR